MFHHPNVIDIGPAWLAHGDGAHTYRVVYFPPAAQNDHTPPDAAKLLFPPPVSKPRPRPQPPKPAPEPQQIATDAEAGDHNSHAGSSQIGRAHV